LPGLSWHFWFLSTWCLYHWERDLIYKKKPLDCYCHNVYTQTYIGHC
jgi:hypothetical protein